MIMRSRQLVASVLAVTASVVLFAQTPDRPTFDVVSVKRNPDAVGGFRVEVQPGGRLLASYVTLQLLVTDAYNIQGYQLVGAPDWFTKEHFDITARAAQDLISDLWTPQRGGGPSLLNLMMRSLLAERFKLIAHRETRQLPVYFLSLARRDGGLGPKLTPATSDCVAKDNCAQGGPPGGGHLAYQSVQISDVLPMLTRATGGRPVLDRTGLTGLFDLDLTWSPDPLPSTPSSTADTSSTGASIFTALQEQLGLKLESTTAPVDVLVIDHVERPTED